MRCAFCVNTRMLILSTISHMASTAMLSCFLWSSVLCWSSVLLILEKSLNFVESYNKMDVYTFFLISWWYLKLYWNADLSKGYVLTISHYHRSSLQHFAQPLASCPTIYHWHPIPVYLSTLFLHSYKKHLSRTELAVGSSWWVWRKGLVLS